jgi:hypothetical protein
MLDPVYNGTPPSLSSGIMCYHSRTVTPPPRLGDAFIKGAHCALNHFRCISLHTPSRIPHQHFGLHCSSCRPVLIHPNLPASLVSTLFHLTQLNLPAINSSELCIQLCCPPAPPTTVLYGAASWPKAICTPNLSPSPASDDCWNCPFWRRMSSTTLQENETIMRGGKQSKNSLIHHSI